MPLHHLAHAALEVPEAIHMMRDATRGGVAAVLNEMAHSARLGITLDESEIPVRPEVHAACELLGLDPLYVANEGKFILIVASNQVNAVLEKLQALRGGTEARRIGEVHAHHPGLLSMQTALQTRRVVPMPLGEQLPRIC
jgi:hydrogenase expression/formation protein HypE